METNSKRPGKQTMFAGLLKKLTVEQLRQIDEEIASLSDAGELRLVVQRGILRFINKVIVHRVEDDKNALEDGRRDASD